MWWYKIRISSLVLLAMFLEACTGSFSETQVIPVRSPMMIASPIEDRIALTATFTVVAEASQGSATATAMAYQPLLTATSTVVTLTPKSVFQVCSPLLWETIPELWEIISDPYAPPPPGRDERHHGVDFSHWKRKGRNSIQGEPVQSILPGKTVAVIINRLPYGNMVIIETRQEDVPSAFFQALGGKAGESLYVLYAHFDNPPLVSSGEWVNCGQVIGSVGMTGYNVVNAHLHLETRLGPAGANFVSMAFYTTTASQEEMDAYRLWRTSGIFRHFDPMKLFKLFLESFEESP